LDKTQAVFELLEAPGYEMGIARREYHLAAPAVVFCLHPDKVDHRVFAARPEASVEIVEDNGQTAPLRLAFQPQHRVDEIPPDCSPPAGQVQILPRPNLSKVNDDWLDEQRPERLAHGGKPPRIGGAQDEQTPASTAHCVLNLCNHELLRPQCLPGMRFFTGLIQDVHYGHHLKMGPRSWSR
jgi:hypothetical protein